MRQSLCENALVRWTAGIPSRSRFLTGLFSFVEQPGMDSRRGLGNPPSSHLGFSHRLASLGLRHVKCLSPTLTHGAQSPQNEWALYFAVQGVGFHLEPSGSFLN
jgi:hypothetical protein